MYQLYATAFNKFPRPVPTPIKNLRPAQETCEQCHWPEKFAGNLDRTYDYFLADETNTPFTVRMTMRVGGGDPSRGPVGGIHWHMNIANKVEYVAARKEEGVWVADVARQTIPWVRITDAQGVVKEFRSSGFTNDPNTFAVRTMDCMDCHNRPAHTFYPTPERAVDAAIAQGRIPREPPFVRREAVAAVGEAYSDRAVALEGIARRLTEFYRAQSGTDARLVA
jgi:hypothetical protein